jgi:hypothetical protein
MVELKIYNYYILNIIIIIEKQFQELIYLYFSGWTINSNFERLS